MGRLNFDAIFQVKVLGFFSPSFAPKPLTPTPPQIQPVPKSHWVHLWNVFCLCSIHPCSLCLGFKVDSQDLGSPKPCVELWDQILSLQLRNINIFFHSPFWGVEGGAFRSYRNYDDIMFMMANRMRACILAFKNSLKFIAQ